VAKAMVAPADGNVCLMAMTSMAPVTGMGRSETVEFLHCGRSVGS
jgi:hypothetical protein